MRAALLLLSALVQISAAATTGDAAPSLPFIVDPATSHIRETATGRTVLFHGLNVVVKGDPWIPVLQGFTGLTFSEVDMGVMQSLGLNVIRLGVMWSGVEPARGQYNTTYLKAMREIVDRAAEYGIYTLVEFHQDILSQRFCADGVPLWTLDPTVTANFPYPLAAPWPVDNSTGYPAGNACDSISWFELYFGEAVCTEFGRLYAPGSEFGAQFGSYWEQVAMTFADSDSVIGYELINEPFAGDVYKDPELLLPGVADLKNFQPFYANISARIRAVDPRHLIFFEPLTWDDFLVGFTDVPGGRESYLNQSVVAFHYYAPPQLDSPLTDFGIMTASIKKQLGCGSFLTEFWAEDQGPASLPAVDATMDAADAYLQSWIGWTYKSFWTEQDFGQSVWYPNGTANPNIVNRVSRTFAPAIAGIAKSMSFDTTTAAFVLTYAIDHTQVSSLQTDVFLHTGIHYPNGFNVVITPPNTVSQSSPAPNRLAFTHSASTPDGTLITITITRTATAAAAESTV